MHYNSHQEMMGKYFKLQVGDTCNSSVRCPLCDVHFVEMYHATATIDRIAHRLDTCVQNLLIRIKSLEERLPE